MADGHVKPENGSARADDALHSWKEIAVYLRREIRTVQRWEKEEGLPVRRHWHRRLGSIYARKAELDAWWNNHHLALEMQGPAKSAEQAFSDSAENVVEQSKWATIRKPRVIVALSILTLAAAGFAAWRVTDGSRAAQVWSPKNSPSIRLPGCLIPDGLVSWWPGEDSAQDVQGSNHGLELGGVGYVTGKQGMAFLLDGLRAVVRVPRPPVQSADFTVAVWVKFYTLEHPPGSNTAEAPQGDMSIVDAMSNDYVNLDGWRLLKHDTQRFLFCLGGGNTNGCYTNGPMVLSKTTVAPNTWYHVAGVKSGSTLAIYVNGKPEMTTQLSTFRNTDSHELRIGSYLLQGAYLNGLVDEVMLFGRGLTPEEILPIYDSTKDGPCQLAQR